MSSPASRVGSWPALLLGAIAVLADLIPILWVYKDRLPESAQQLLYPGILLFLVVPAFFIGLTGLFLGRRAMRRAPHQITQLGMALCFAGTLLAAIEAIVAVVAFIQFAHYCQTAPTGCY